MSGTLKIIGLGPGSAGLITPDVKDALETATDAIGYYPYVARVIDRPGLTIHGSDNRVELQRAKQALKLAGEGKHVLVVSSGDPGVFAMASAVFEAVETGPLSWRELDITVLPGITAMLAAAARLGAPLGHDFCVISLSDNLKPWSIIEERLRFAAEADFAMAFYNPCSKTRPNGFKKVLDILKNACEKERLVMFARAVSTPAENLRIVTLSEAIPDMADMQTVVLIGSSQTRLISRKNAAPLVYTPRSMH